MEEMAAMGDAAKNKNEMESVQTLKIGMNYKGGKIAYLLTNRIYVANIAQEA